jgi:hypothetical protein
VRQVRLLIVRTRRTVVLDGPDRRTRATPQTDQAVGSDLVIVVRRTERAFSKRFSVRIQILEVRIEPVIMRSRDKRVTGTSISGIRIRKFPTEMDSVDKSIPPHRGDELRRKHAIPYITNDCNNRSIALCVPKIGE